MTTDTLLDLKRRYFLLTLPGASVSDTTADLEKRFWQYALDGNLSGGSFSGTAYDVPWDNTPAGLPTATDVGAGLNEVTALSRYGTLVYVDQQVGATDYDKIVAAMAKQQSLTTFFASGNKSAVAFGCRIYTVSTTITLVNGIRFVGLSGTSREYDNVGPCLKNSSTDMFTVNGVTVRDISIEGMQFQGSLTNLNTHWLTPELTDGSAGQLRSSAIHDCAFKGFATIIKNTPLTVVEIARLYVNWIGETAFKLYGSDCEMSWCVMDSSFNGAVPNLSASEVLLETATLSKSTLAHLFLTGSPAVPLRVSGGKGNQYTHIKLDAPGDGTVAKATQGSDLLITGGEGHRFRDIYCFNSMAVPASGPGGAGGNVGVVTVTGGEDIYLDGFVFDLDSAAGQVSQTPVTVPPIAVIGGTSVQIGKLGYINGHQQGVHIPTGVTTSVLFDDGGINIKSGEFTMTVGNGSATASPTLNQLHVSPVTIYRTCDQIAFECTGVASSFARWGIWSDVNGRPGTLLFDSGQVATTVTGMVTIAVGSTALNGRAWWAGRYWIGVVGQGVAPTLRWKNGYINNIPVLAAGTGTTAPCSMYQGSVSGALPTTLTPTANSSNGPYAFLRAA
jgi:hypothetical protein